MCCHYSSMEKVFLAHLIYFYYDRLSLLFTYLTLDMFVHILNLIQAMFRL